MQRVQIQVEGIPLDTFEGLDNEFYITKQNFDLRNLQTREADYTRNLSLPATDKNRTLLNIQSNEIIENRRLQCIVSVDGITIFFAFLLVVRIDIKNIDVAILSGAFELFDEIPDNGLQSLDLSAYDFNYTLAGFAGIKDNTEGITFSNIEYFDYDSMDDGTAPNIRNTTSRPIDHHGVQMYCKTVLKEIIEQAGYTLNDFTDDYYQRLFLTIPINIPSIQSGAHSGDVERGAISFIYDAWASAALPVVVQFDTVISNPNSLWTNYKYTIVNTNTYSLATELLYDYTRLSNGEMTFAITVNGTKITEYSRNTSITGATESLFIITQLAAGDVVEVTIEADFNNINSADIVEIKQGSSFEIYEDPNPATGILRVSEWIPDINQRDFVLDVCKFFNVVLDVDPFLRECTLKTFNAIIADQSQDLTNNYDTSQDAVNEISLPYYRESILSYSNDAIEREDTNYTAFFNADESLPKYGTIVNSLFSASDFQPGDATQTRLMQPYFKMRYQVVQGFSITAATTLYSTLNDNDFKPGDWVFDGTDYYRIASIVNKKTGNLWIPHVAGFSGDVQRVEVSFDDLTPRVGLFQSNTGAGGAVLNYNAFGPNTSPTSFTGVKVQEMPTWDLWHSLYYTNLFSAIKTPKILQVWMKFTALEFYQIDMLRPVWIEGLNGYYYINRINQWKLNTLCQVELIRINRLI